MEHPVAGQVAQATQHLVTGVEQAELHHLVGLDVVDDLDAGVLVRGAGRSEKLSSRTHCDEGFGHDGPTVDNAEALGDGRPVLVGGLGRDPVHHRIGEPGAAVHPVGQVGVLGPGESR